MEFFSAAMSSHQHRNWDRIRAKGFKRFALAYGLPKAVIVMIPAATMAISSRRHTYWTFAAVLPICLIATAADWITREWRYNKTRPIGDSSTNPSHENEATL